MLCNNVYISLYFMAWKRCILFTVTPLTWYFINEKVGFKDTTLFTNRVLNGVLHKPYFVAAEVILNIQAEICNMSRECLKTYRGTFTDML